MPADPQTLIPMSAFETSHTLEGLPDLKVHAVSDIVVTFPSTPASSNKSRSGKENHQIRDPGKAEYMPVTISFHGNKDDTKKAYECFDKCGKGNPLRGAFTVTIVNPKDAYKAILTINMHDNTLLSYNPLSGIDVDNPDTLTCDVTLAVGRMELKV